jgi:hypothetical protein
MTATVHKILNRFSPLFRNTSLVTLRASDEMRIYRKHVMKTLKANGYSVGFVEHLAFMPHISVRLGIPYTKQAKLLTSQNFAADTELTFRKWIILRDIKKDGKYLVKQIALEA